MRLSKKVPHLCNVDLLQAISETCNMTIGKLSIVSCSLSKKNGVVEEAVKMTSPLLSVSVIPAWFISKGSSDILRPVIQQHAQIERVCICQLEIFLSTA